MTFSNPAWASSYTMSSAVCLCRLRTLVHMEIYWDREQWVEGKLAPAVQGSPAIGPFSLSLVVPDHHSCLSSSPSLPLSPFLWPPLPFMQQLPFFNTMTWERAGQPQVRNFHILVSGSETAEQSRRQIGVLCQLNCRFGTMLRLHRRELHKERRKLPSSASTRVLCFVG